MDGASKGSAGQKLRVVRMYLHLSAQFVKQILQTGAWIHRLFRGNLSAFRNILAKKKKPITISCKEGKANHLNFKAGEVQLSKP